MSELTAEVKEQIHADSLKKLEFVQREYWRCRNGKQRYMRCPFYSPLDHPDKRKNFPGAPRFCCELFAKAFKAVLDRQDEVDKAASAAKTIHDLSKAMTVN